MSYFISPPAETPWNIAASTLREQLQMRWQVIQVKDTRNVDSNHVLEWKIAMEYGALHGSLDRAGQAIHLESDIRNCAVFALWFRTLVPHDQPLLFFDEGYAVDIVLDTATTTAQIVDAFVTR